MKLEFDEMMKKFNFEEDESAIGMRTFVFDDLDICCEIAVVEELDDTFVVRIERQSLRGTRVYRCVCLNVFDLNDVLEYYFM